MYRHYIHLLIWRHHQVVEDFLRTRVMMYKHTAQIINMHLVYLDLHMHISYVNIYIYMHITKTYIYAYIRFYIPKSSKHTLHIILSCHCHSFYFSPCPVDFSIRHLGAPDGQVLTDIGHPPQQGRWKSSGSQPPPGLRHVCCHVVEPAQLKNMNVKLGIIFPGRGWK